MQNRHSIFLIIVLFALFAGSLFFTPLALFALYLNEQTHIAGDVALSEGKDELVLADDKTRNPANDGRLVYITGKPTAHGPVIDHELGLSVSGAALSRKTEMYQWSRMRAPSKFQRRYSYNEKWSEKRIDSNGYPREYRNPLTMPIKSDRFYPDKVTVGAFTLKPSLLDKIDGASKPVFGEKERAAVAKKRGGSVMLVDGHFYLGSDTPEQPHIGDIRVSYEVTPLPENITIVAEQTKDGALQPLKASDLATIGVARAGVHSPDGVWQGEIAKNTASSWAARVVLVVMILIAIRLLFFTLNFFEWLSGLMEGVNKAGGMKISALSGLGLSVTIIGFARLPGDPVTGAISFISGVFLLFHTMKLIKHDDKREAESLSM